MGNNYLKLKNDSDISPRELLNYEHEKSVGIKTGDISDNFEQPLMSSMIEGVLNVLNQKDEKYAVINDKYTDFSFSAENLKLLSEVEKELKQSKEEIEKLLTELDEERKIRREENNCFELIISEISDEIQKKSKRFQKALIAYHTENELLRNEKNSDPDLILRLTKERDDLYKQIDNAVNSRKYRIGEMIFITLKNPLRFFLWGKYIYNIMKRNKEWK